MIMTPHGERYVHQTTMWILQRLKTYSWDAKALVTLAAFALEYGNLLYLTDTSTSDQLVNSLKQLNQIQNRKVTVPSTDLVALIMEVFHHIHDWATWSGVGYD
ncbi:sieve element-occluding protein 1, partial [Trifolium medium]|nr:sieve element-occluding protein 1 [Trifolium medium]